MYIYNMRDIVEKHFSISTCRSGLIYLFNTPPFIFFLIKFDVSFMTVLAFPGTQ
jgi:hypothetical protein